jgi:hypothetical protein
MLFWSSRSRRRLSEAIFSNLDAAVEIAPAMSGEDLLKGLGKASQIAMRVEMICVRQTIERDLPNKTTFLCNFDAIRELVWLPPKQRWKIVKNDVRRDGEH